MTSIDTRRHMCTDCGVRLYNGHRASKHSKKTGHRTIVNARAENAVRKYRASLNPSYLDRLTARDQMIESRGGE